MEQSQKMTEKLEAIEKGLKDKPKDDKPKEDKDDDDGWGSVQKFFKGKQGVGKAKKFIKFLNMLSVME